MKREEDGILRKNRSRLVEHFFGEVDKFKYMGVMIANNVERDEEIRRLYQQIRHSIQRKSYQRVNY